MYAGPNIVRDGLVFGYDTGANPSSGFDHRVDSRRYFKGKNTTNLQASGVAFGHSSGTYGNVVTVADAPEKGTGWKKVTISNRGSNFRIIQWTYTSMSANLEYWHSVVFDWGNMRGKGYYINHDGSGTGQRYFYKPGGYNTNLGSSVSINSSLGDGRIISKIIHTAAHTHAFFINNNTYNVSGLNDYFYYKEYQVEQSAYATPYVAGTRSSTNSLIDLNKSTTIDVSNVSFGSDGLPTFDGTDDLITVNPGTFPSSWSQPFTLEAIVYIPSSATWYNIGSGLGIVGRGSYTGSWGLMRGSGNNTVYFWIRTGGNTFNPGGTIGRDKYYHILGTWNGSNQAIFYINGNQNSQETSSNVGTTVDNTGNIVIGGNIAFGGNNGGYGEGTYPVVKIYNRALSAQEVKRNYKAYKNRFNL